ncbi:hypothetical protein V1477_010895 [Vespula maculifrons]|uniref:Uncharacterized protein n=1 Tax=Vespula maculifrons TaxID=7453 RepID=A0ABD2C389_VESMC
MGVSTWLDTEEEEEDDDEEKDKEKEKEEEEEEEEEEKEEEEEEVEEAVTRRFEENVVPTRLQALASTLNWMREFQIEIGLIVDSFSMDPSEFYDYEIIPFVQLYGLKVSNSLECPSTLEAICKFSDRRRFTGYLTVSSLRVIYRRSSDSIMFGSSLNTLPLTFDSCYIQFLEGTKNLSGTQGSQRRALPTAQKRNEFHFERREKPIGRCLENNGPRKLDGSCKVPSKSKRVEGMRDRDKDGDGNGDEDGDKDEDEDGTEE